MKIRKMVSLLLALVMAAGLLPAAAFADGTGVDQPGSGQPSGPDQPGGDEPYSFFEDLKIALESGGSVELDKDIIPAQPEVITIPKGVGSYLDMCSYTVGNVSFIVNGDLTMTGGVIDNSDNNATSVTVNGGGSFALNGVNIKSGSQYDVYCDNGSFTLIDCIVNGMIYLNGTFMEIGGPLQNNVYTVKTESPRVFTNGLRGKGTAANFVSADSRYIVGLNGDGEAVIGEPVTVTFDPNGGSAVEPQTVPTGGVPARPEDPVKEGCVFTGWKLPDGGYYDFGTPVTGEMTLTAEWEEAPKFMTHSLALDGKIGVNFFMDLSMLSDEEKAGSYMVFKIGGKGGRTKTVGFDPQFTGENDGSYGFAFYVSSIQMADKITATFHYTRSGAEKTVVEEYSVKEYIKAFDNSGITDETTVKLVHALADYGHYVQPFLSRARGWTLGQDHAEMDRRYTDAAAFDLDRIIGPQYAAMTENITGVSMGKVSISLTLDTDTAINMYFTPSDSYSGILYFDESDITDITDKKVTFTECGDGRYRATVSGIAAHELGEIYKFTVTTAFGGYTVIASAMSYVYSALTYYHEHPGDDPGGLGRRAVQTLYEYWRAAEDYVEVHGGGSD